MRLQRIKNQAMNIYSRLQVRAGHVLASDTLHVPSPCVSVCVVNAKDGLCEGCLRTLDEVAAWGQMQSEQQRQVWRRIQVRCAERLVQS